MSLIIGGEERQSGGAGEEGQKQRERTARGMARWDGQTNLQSEMADS